MTWLLPLNHDEGGLAIGESWTNEKGKTRHGAREWGEHGRGRMLEHESRERTRKPRNAIAPFPLSKGVRGIGYLL